MWDWAEETDYSYLDEESFGDLSLESSPDGMVAQKVDIPPGSYDTTPFDPGLSLGDDEGLANTESDLMERAGEVINPIPPVTIGSSIPGTGLASALTPALESGLSKILAGVSDVKPKTGTYGAGTPLDLGTTLKAPGGVLALCVIVLACLYFMRG